MFVCLLLSKVLLGLTLLGIACENRLPHTDVDRDSTPDMPVRFPMERTHDKLFSPKKDVPLEQVERYTMISRIY